MGPPSRFTRTTPQRGFSLIEILVVLVIVAVLIAMASALTRGVSAAQKRSLTATRIAAIDSAMVQFVMKNRRLPCPADGRIATGMPNAGVEIRDGLGACTPVNQANGVVPWVTLGLAEGEATDGWDRRFTYRTPPALAADAGTDMSWCDPAGTSAGPLGGACNTACTNANLANCTPPNVYLSGRGLQIQSVVGAVLMNPSPLPAPGSPTGAAYVVISHGESGGGAYLNSGVLSTTSTTDGLEEQKNYADLAARPYYVDDSITDVAGANHFDDSVSRPSVLAVITKAALGPRSH